MAQKARPKRRTLTHAERDSLRFAAETYYTLSPGDISLSAMCRVPQFENISPETMQRWAHDGGWLARRQQNQDSLRDMLRYRLAHSLVEDRVRHMEAQQWICDEGLSLLENDRLQPKGGWEGVAGAVVGTMRNMEQMRKDVVEELTSGLSAPNADASLGHVDDDISPEEARAAARALVEVRQRSLRALPAAGDVAQQAR